MMLWSVHNKREEILKKRKSANVKFPIPMFVSPKVLTTRRQDQMLNGSLFDG
jgi:hypothetical protein